MNKSIYKSPSMKEIKVRADHGICQASPGIIEAYVASKIDGGDDFESIE